MTIAICDDNILEAEQLEQLICTYALQKKYDLHCRCFTSGTELLKQEEKYNLYYLDYEMGDLNSLELAQSLKEKFHSSVLQIKRIEKQDLKSLSESDIIMSQLLKDCFHLRQQMVKGSLFFLLIQAHAPLSYRSS